MMNNNLCTVMNKETPHGKSTQPGRVENWLFTLSGLGERELSDFRSPGPPNFPQADFWAGMHSAGMKPELHGLCRGGLGFQK
jgi:hypothetical protein